MKPQEELQTHPEKLRREAKEKEIANLQENLVRKSKIAEKEIEMQKFQIVVGLACEGYHPVQLAALLH